MVSQRVVVVATACAVVAASFSASAARAAPDDVLPVPPVPVPALPDVTLPTLGAPATLPAASAAAADPPATAGEERTAKVVAAAAAARALTAEVNRVRRAHNLKPLRISAQLARAGTEHAQALAFAGLFTHAWPDGSPFSSWIRRYYPAKRYRRWSTGENLAWRSPDLSARDAVRMWLASPTHRRNLLKPAWREVGLGVVRAQAAPGAYGGSDVVLAAAEFGVRAR